MPSSSDHGVVMRSEPEMRPREKAEEHLDAHLIALAIFLPALPYLFVVSELERRGYARKAREFRLFALLGLLVLVGLIVWLRHR